MKITRTLCLAALLCCVPATVVISGCGGGNSSLPLGSVPGTYTGTFGVVSGPDATRTGTISLTISSTGVITGSVTNAGTSTAIPFTGTANTTSGIFTVTGLFGDTSGTGTGAIRSNSGVIRGSGTFHLTNGDLGNLTFAKTNV